MKPVPTLFCIGSPSCGKSSLLNKIFQVQFEVMEQDSVGLFHDSVDALFSSDDLPIGFNVFDFQGAVANQDYVLIERLLLHWPNAYLLIQLDSMEYFENVFMKISEEVRKNFSNRVLVIQKFDKAKKMDVLKANKNIPKCFPGFAKA